MLNLSELVCVIDEAENGLQAFNKVEEAFKKNDKKDLYSLIILDLTMPVWNGYQACKSIRELYAQNGQY